MPAPLPNIIVQDEIPPIRRNTTAAIATTMRMTFQLLFTNTAARFAASFARIAALFAVWAAFFVFCPVLRTSFA